MIVEKVRMKEKQIVTGHQHDESYNTCYDVQIFVFNKWWSLSEDLEDLIDLQKALKLRDEITDRLHGR